eukprot:6203829-Prymnesium_polylepis.1
MCGRAQPPPARYCPAGSFSSARPPAALPWRPRSPRARSPPLSVCASRPRAWHCSEEWPDHQPRRRRPRWRCWAAAACCRPALRACVSSCPWARASPARAR